MDAYEYKTIALDRTSGMDDELNALGKGGWELVSIISNPRLGSTKYALVGITVSTLAFFKRKYKSDTNGGK